VLFPIPVISGSEHAWQACNVAACSAHVEDVHTAILELKNKIDGLHTLYFSLDKLLRFSKIH
jgi:hypothetical protein